jgi:hypothetical protein
MADRKRENKINTFSDKSNLFNIYKETHLNKNITL